MLSSLSNFIALSLSLSLSLSPSISCKNDRPLRIQIQLVDETKQARLNVRLLASSTLCHLRLSFVPKVATINRSVMLLVRCGGHEGRSACASLDPGGELVRDLGRLEVSVLLKDVEPVSNQAQ
jgi:hypothetical protein